jgi:large subunit ribosomal protein L29
MKATQLAELRELSDEDLGAKVDELKEQTFRLRFKLALGNTDTVKQIRTNRKDMARVQTLLRERELAASK